MKLNGIFGTGSGKTGNAVFATSAGKQIVRTYQPKVTNPNTDAQIAQRAKFKLLSQLAAAMAPVIVIPKSGLVSARNRFVTKNIPLATYANDKASIELADIQLTDSQVSMPAMARLETFGDNGLMTMFNVPIANVADKVRYALFKKTEDAKLQLVDVKVVNVEPDATAYATVTFENLQSGKYVLYAYGMKAKNASASVGYNDYDTEAGETTADLESSVRISTYNYNFTMTQAGEGEIA